MEFWKFIYLKRNCQSQKKLKFVKGIINPVYLTLKTFLSKFRELILIN